MLPVAFDPILDSSEKHFHKDGLGTEPPAENPTKSNGKQDNEQYEYDHRQPEEVKILWPENLPEDDKLPLQDVNHKKWFATYLNPRPTEQDSQQNITQPLAPVVVSAFRLFRIDPLSVSTFI
jgi:hypothetical protein